MSTLKVIGVDATTGEQKVYDTGDTIEGAGGGGAFTDLSDVPSSYTGESLKVVRVNAGAPTMGGTSTTGLTTALPATATAPGTVTTSFWGCVS